MQRRTLCVAGASSKVASHTASPRVHVDVFADSEAPSEVTADVQADRQSRESASRLTFYVSATDVLRIAFRWSDRGAVRHKTRRKTSTDVMDGHFRDRIRRSLTPSTTLRTTTPYPTPRATPSIPTPDDAENSINSSKKRQGKGTRLARHLSTSFVCAIEKRN